MKNSEFWQETKYVFRSGVFRSSLDRNEVGVASRLIADLVAGFYFKYIGKYTSGFLLDVGCGKAPLYGCYRQYVEDVVCVDWPNSQHESCYLDYECDLNNGLPLPSGYFDTIICSDVIEHIYNPKELFNDFHRVLKPGGVIMLNVPFYYWLHEEPFDYYRYTSHLLKRFCEESGFDIEVLEEVGGVPEILIDIISKYVVKKGFLGLKLSAALQSIAFTSLRYRFLRKISINTKSKFPLGYFMVARKRAEVG